MASKKQGIGAKEMALGIYQIVGGMIGCITLVASISNGSRISPLILAVGFLFYLFSIIIGFLFLMGRKVGFNLTYINQVIQLFVIAGGNLKFFLLSGIGLVIEFDFSRKVKINFEALLSKFQFGLFENESYSFGINFFALFILIALTRARR